MNIELFQNNDDDKRIKKLPPFPSVDDNLIKIIIDDQQRRISLLLQHSSIKPFIAFVQYGPFIFVCDERRIYITAIKSKFYNPLGIYDEFKIIYDNKYAPDLTDLSLDFKSKRLFFLNEQGDIGYIYLCPLIRFGGKIVPHMNNNNNNHNHDDYKHESVQFLFVDNINQKLLWGDENQIIKCNIDDGEHVELVHKFGFIQLTQKLDSRPMDIDGDCLYWNDRNSLYKLSSSNGQMNRVLEDARFITNKIKVVDDGKYVYFLSMGHILYRIDLTNKRPKFEKILQLLDQNFTITSFDIIDSMNEEWCPHYNNNHMGHDDHMSIWEKIAEYGWGKKMKTNLAIMIMNVFITIIMIILTLFILYFWFYPQKLKDENNDIVNVRNNNQNNDDDDNMVTTKNKLSGIESSSSLSSAAMATNNNNNNNSKSMMTTTNRSPQPSKSSFLSQQLQHQQQQQQQQPQFGTLSSTNPKMSIQL
ncbi:hypothetical protein DERF_007764 [Dermatophagoides farinae]|uniref:Uncharacterized protein n=1 Tax=Dermatophagoides farinae TaxID=6954 RepID=A0A922L6B3_DERFA|nr:hypothetical protein DERF_007764 [Dermatophagoides farinae]